MHTKLCEARVVSSRLDAVNPLFQKPVTLTNWRLKQIHERKLANEAMGNYQLALRVYEEWKPFSRGDD